jgi:hypothetical protein
MRPAYSTGNTESIFYQGYETCSGRLRSIAGSLLEERVVVDTFREEETTSSTISYLGSNVALYNIVFHHSQIGMRCRDGRGTRTRSIFPV